MPTKPCLRNDPHDGHLHSDGWSTCPGVVADEPTDLTETPDATAPGLRQQTAGRCGCNFPAMYGGPPHNCALPANHAGWHRSDNGAEWTNTATTSQLDPAALEALDRVGRAAEQAAEQQAQADAARPAVYERYALTAEQEIRARALDFASRYGPIGPDEVVDVAQKLAAWISDGTRP